MKIEINIKKPHLYIVIALVVILSGVIIVIGQVDKSKAYHTGEAIEVTIDTQPFTLQDALDNVIDGTQPVAEAINADTVGYLTPGQLQGSSVSCGWQGDKSFTTGDCGQGGCQGDEIPSLRLSCDGSRLTSVSVECTHSSSCTV